VTRLLVVAWLVACGGKHAATPGPDPVALELKLAEQAEQARDHTGARAHYEAAIRAARTPAQIDLAHREFAETLITWGEVHEAERHLVVAVDANPDDAGAWHDLGLVRHAHGDHANGIVALERARSLRPKDPRPRIALAALRWKIGDKAGAKVEYQALLALDLPEKVRAKVEWALGVLDRND